MPRESRPSDRFFLVLKDRVPAHWGGILNGLLTLALILVAWRISPFGIGLALGLLALAGLIIGVKLRGQRADRWESLLVETVLTLGTASVISLIIWAGDIQGRITGHEKERSQTHAKLTEFVATGKTLHDDLYRRVEPGQILPPPPDCRDLVLRYNAWTAAVRQYLESNRALGQAYVAEWDAADNPSIDPNANLHFPSFLYGGIDSHMDLLLAWSHHFE